MRRVISLIPLAAIMAISACQTIKGAGQDIETAGHTLFPPGQTPGQTYSSQPSGVYDPGTNPVIEIQPFDGGGY